MEKYRFWRVVDDSSALTGSGGTGSAEEDNLGAPSNRRPLHLHSDDRHAVARRLRQLLGEIEPAAAAARLRIPEPILRMAIDENDPQPMLDVIVAVVEEYAVDPSWLITGDYDQSRHQMILDSEPRVADVVREVARDRRTSGDTPVIIRPQGGTDR